jgi:hypothetical protein
MFHIILVILFMKNFSQKLTPKGSVGDKKPTRYRTPSTFRANIKAKKHEILSRNKKIT